MASPLHRLVILMKCDYYAYVEKIKYNMSMIDIFITFVTLHSIYPICSFVCHFTHNTGKMCNNHAHLKKWKILVVGQPKNVTMKRRTEFEEEKKIGLCAITEDANHHAINSI